MPYSIYRLDDPRDNTYRYVGLSKEPHRRFAMHLLYTGDAHLPKDQWIEELRGLGLVPIMVIIESNIPTIGEGRKREAYWIKTLKNNGAPLLNQNLPYWSEMPYILHTPKKSMENKYHHPCWIPPRPPRPENSEGKSLWDMFSSNPPGFADSDPYFYIRTLSRSMGGRLVNRYNRVEGKSWLYIHSLRKSDDRQNTLVPLNITMSQLYALTEDEAIALIERAVAISEGREVLVGSESEVSYPKTK